MACARVRKSSGSSAHLVAVGLPTRIRDIPGLEADADAILSAMRQDKKVERGRLTFILAKGIGETFIARDVDEAGVRVFLTQDLELRSA